jgi:uroporphyrinogen-III synthase
VIPVIIARPEPGNKETADAARTLGLEVVSCPLFELKIIHLNHLNSNDYDAIFITSVNSLRAIQGKLTPYHHLPLYAVGPISAAAARAAGFTKIIEGSADGAALAERAAKDGCHRLLHLAGMPHKPVAHPALSFDVHYVYEMAELPVPDLLKAALSRPCVILAHSPRIARTLAGLTPLHSQCHMVAISAQTAEAAGKGWASLTWPDQPNSQAMLERAALLCRGG